ncbi:hypothetical protein KUCAC02_029646 [Chaenocephalus aceratus]|nr:hypothetical protein KUCAC02_029646 [Chaenocephalus aceratus]
MSPMFHGGGEGCCRGLDAKQKLFIFQTAMTDAASLSLSPQLLPSVTERIPVFLATTLSSSTLSSSSLFASSNVEMTDPSWTSAVTTTTSRNALLGRPAMTRNDDE